MGTLNILKQLHILEVAPNSVNTTLRSKTRKAGEKTAKLKWIWAGYVCHMCYLIGLIQPLSGCRRTAKFAGRLGCAYEGLT